jgi:polyisoprenyl-phosphate glycosyltransferase
MPELSIVVSIYNEAPCLEQFWDALNCSLTLNELDAEVIFVDDGSTDGSDLLLKRIAQDHLYVRVISFSRNFGHEAAMTAGIDYSQGQAVICMDADLQHPPEKIPEMLEAFRQGYEVVTMIRLSHGGIGFIRSLATRAFYGLLNTVSPFRFESNASDFFLISHRVRDLLRDSFRERTRYLRGLIQVVGFRRTSLTFVAPPRVAGQSKYTLWCLMLHSIAALSVSSDLPLRVGTVTGLTVIFFNIIFIIYSITMKILGFTTPGYTTIVVLIGFLFAIQFFLMGIIGEYIANIFHENKRRPIYIVDKVVDSGQTLSPGPAGSDAGLVP